MQYVRIPIRSWVARFLFLVAALSFSTAIAAAQPKEVGPTRFAIVVGSNEGNATQQPLRFARDDARDVAAVLTQVGRYERGAVQVLADPDVAELRRTISGLRHELEALAARDEPTQLFFYYSGHANAKSLNLGQQEFALRGLRDLLMELPATLTVVVLDACQSGAFSRPKGAEPASDFAYNSVAGLTTEGLAVMASSSGDELSQESDELQSSYFTHHLLVAMRGAGDENRDGRVTLEEAYQYAYNRTLRDTSQTRIGGQHVTLERDLTGHGAIPLSYPREADATLALGAALSGTFLVQQPEGGAVMAEVKKPRGQELELALPSGAYEIGWRDGTEIKRCEVELVSGAPVPIGSARCRRDPRRSGEAKGLRLDPEEALTPRKRRIGRMQLAIGQSLHGAAIGAEICVLADCDNPRVWAASAIAGTGVGLAVSLLATPEGIHPATASSINGGMLWGATSSYLLFGTIHGGEEDSGSLNERALVGSFMAGQFAGIGLGVLADRLLQPTQGEVAGSVGAGWWGAGLTALLWAGIDRDGINVRAFHGTMFAVSQLAFFGGYFLADHVDMSRGRVLILHAGGFLGGGLGALGTFLIRGDDAERSGFAIAGAAGAAIGLGLTYFLTRNFDKPDPPIQVGLAPTHGGVMAHVRLTL